MRIKTLYERTEPARQGDLAEELQRLYDGDLVFPTCSMPRPFIVGNFVETLDGVVSFKISGKAGGDEISGRNDEDAFIMGLLRCYADAVLIGEETFRVGHGHVWTADFICPSMKEPFEDLRRTLHKPVPYPLTVIVSGTGTVDLDEALFRRDDIRTLVLTTERGKQRLHNKYGTIFPTEVRALPGDLLLDAGDIVALLYDVYGIKMLLHEGGPRLFSAFLEKYLLDELFLTMAPQIVGRGSKGERPNLSGPLAFTPDNALWGSLMSVKYAPTGHLFLRYSWDSKRQR